MYGNEKKRQDKVDSDTTRSRTSLRIAFKLAQFLRCSTSSVHAPCPYSDPSTGITRNLSKTVKTTHYSNCSMHLTFSLRTIA